ncbi:MAG: hypothetical protein DRJ52_01510 [Thermoprotei archaeon]|nr:MAG: hypothetical protein DRJ52_01510 [Thermoprotei archaeon]RLF00159.1 MAG: hypothetical protein DRJ63_03330 [Thermoprotei archaeon]HDI74995.1 isopentenyl phosphate kinase family protein [Thermoprotei archaeon]
MGSFGKNLLKSTVVVKLGGSALTVKKEKPVLRLDVIRRISKEIASVKDLRRIILVHGAGSFGHPQALKWISKHNREALLEISETKEYVERLNNIIVRYLRESGLPVYPLHPSAMARMCGTRLMFFDIYPVFHLLKQKYIPLLHGDVVPDYKRGFSILSGDTIARILAVAFRAEYLVYGLDVDGIFVDGRLVRYIRESDIDEKVSALKPARDATGGIYLKLNEAFKAAKQGVKVVFVNLLHENRLRNILLGKIEETPCTLLY